MMETSGYCQQVEQGTAVLEDAQTYNSPNGHFGQGGCEHCCTCGCHQRRFGYPRWPGYQPYYVWCNDNVIETAGLR